MELLAIAGAGITIPPALSLAYEAITYAVRVYQQVQNRRKQLKLLINRCYDLLEEVRKQIAKGPAEFMQDNIMGLERACKVVSETVADLAKKGFVWCLFHRDDIDQKIALAETTVQDALQRFNFIAHLDIARFQVEMQEASQTDQADLVNVLTEISHMDHKILAVLEDREHQFRRMEELLVGLSKYIQVHGANVPPNAPPEDTFIRAAATALQRVSNRTSLDVVPHWTLTSLEVSVHFDQEIGRGSFGCIYQGDWDGKIVAVKKMYPEDAQALDSSHLKELRAEVQIWSRLAHPNINQFYGACLEAQQPFVVSSFCAYGNAIKYLSDHPEANRIQLMDDIASGMRYLHGQNIVHADLKGVNVLINDNREAVLTDFGLSRLLDDIASTARSRTTARAVLALGTPRWMSPECLEGGRPTKASDVYSFGITAWELFSDQLPYSGTREKVLYMAVINRQLRPSRPARLKNNALWDLIQRCWAHEPSARPSFAAIGTALRPQLRSITGASLRMRRTNDAVDVAGAPSPRTPSPYLSSSAHFESLSAAGSVRLSPLAPSDVWPQRNKLSADILRDAFAAESRIEGPVDEDYSLASSSDSTTIQVPPGSPLNALVREVGPSVLSSYNPWTNPRLVDPIRHLLGLLRSGVTSPKRSLDEVGLLLQVVSYNVGLTPNYTEKCVDLGIIPPLVQGALTCGSSRLFMDFISACVSTLESFVARSPAYGQQAVEAGIIDARLVRLAMDRNWKAAMSYQAILHRLWPKNRALIIKVNGDKLLE